MLMLLRIIVFYGFFLFVLAFASILIVPNNDSLFLTVSFLGPLVPIYFIEKKYLKKRKQKEAEEFVERIEQDKLLIRPAVEKHRAALKRNLRKAIKVNDYGATVSDERRAVIIEFLASVNIQPVQMSYLHVLSYAESLIEAEDEVTQEEVGFNPNLLPSDGFEFEEWVARSLNMFDWDAKVTQGSGDQGVDVLASKEGKTVAIQCKLYSSPVGNKAVQEAFSGAKFYDAQYAAVLTNAGFTSSAKDLAASTGVMLLSPEDIPTFKL